MGGEVFLMYILRHFVILDFSNPHFGHVIYSYFAYFWPCPSNIADSNKQLIDGFHKVEFRD